MDVRHRIRWLQTVFPKNVIERLTVVKMTIRSLVKKSLVEKGYPVEISEWHKRNTHVNNLYTKSVKQEGIELVRELTDKYQACMHKSDKIETLFIHTNNYIDVAEMQKIVDECKKDYHPYKTDVIVYVY